MISEWMWLQSVRQKTSTCKSKEYEIRLKSTKHTVNKEQWVKPSSNREQKLELQNLQMWNDKTQNMKQEILILINSINIFF